MVFNNPLCLQLCDYLTHFSFLLDTQFVSLSLFDSHVAYRKLWR